MPPEQKVEFNYGGEMPHTKKSGLNTLLLAFILIALLVVIWLLVSKKPAVDESVVPMGQTQTNQNSNGQDYQPGQQVQEQPDPAWKKSPTFGLYYSSSFNPPTEYYRISGQGPGHGTIVDEPSANTVPVFSLVFSDGKAQITWGDVWKGGYMPGTCPDVDIPPFEYGVSGVACVKGYRTWVGHFSARDSVSKDELKVFGDFVLKNQ